MCAGPGIYEVWRVRRRMLSSENGREGIDGSTPSAQETLARLVGIQKEFVVRRPERAHTETLVAVNDVSLSIRTGETLGLIGESGSGKSTTGKILANLTAPDRGFVEFAAKRVTGVKERNLKKSFRKDVSMIFQNPSTSLSPHLKIEQIMLEPLEIHGIGNRESRRESVREKLALVSLESTVLNQYPDSLSGGQRQRVGIARALMLDPKLVIADEPTASLDVSVQAQIINLLVDLQKRLDLSLLFITHDLALLNHIADRIAVMFLGEIVEIGDRSLLDEAPQHPYTAILASMNRLKYEVITPLGDPPSPVDRPSGCVFRTRCPIAKDICAVERPTLRRFESGHGGLVACHFPGELQLTRVSDPIGSTLGRVQLTEGV